MFKIKRKNKIELISIHIPKTGGRSFYEILRFVYGSKLDKRTKREDYFPPDQSNKESFDLMNDVAVLHGHLSFSQIKDKMGRNTKLITWFREPVDRVISNYYFFMYRISVGKVEKAQLDKVSLSLLEFARLESARNIMSKFLYGAELKDFSFIGDFGNFRQEVQSLGLLLNWPKNLPDVFENKTKDLNIFSSCTTKPSEITENMRDQIIEVNGKDYLLFNQWKEMRNGS